MNLVAYLRVSTDDKGQNPQRQADILQSYAKRNGSTILATFTDEGTSGGISPLERIQVGLAIKKAKELNADGIIVESVDRWTRKGVQDFFETSTTLELRHKLKLVLADVPQGMDGMAYEIYTSLMAIVAKAFRERLREQIKSGLARAKREGWKNGEPGRKRKPNLAPEEAAYVREQRLLGSHGAGWGRMALELTRRRGAAEVVDLKARDKRIVTASWLRAEWRRIESGSMIRTWRPVGITAPIAAGAGATQETATIAIQEVAKGGQT